MVAIAIPEPLDPHVLVPIRWEPISRTADGLAPVAAKASTAADDLDKLNSPDLWQGTAGDDFRKKLATVQGLLKVYADTLPKIVKVLRELSDTVRIAQGECAYQIIPQVQQAQQLHAQHLNAVADYHQLKAAHDQALAASPQDTADIAPLPDKPGKDPGEDVLYEAQQRYGDVADRVNHATAHATLQLRGHLDALWGTPQLNFLQQFGKGVWDESKNLANLPWEIAPARILVDGPQQYFTDLLSVGEQTGMSTNPVLAGVQDYDLVKAFIQNPGYTAGNVVPDLILGLALPEGARPLSPSELEALPAGDGIPPDVPDAPPDPLSTPDCVPGPSKCVGGEPVNLATGEMFLTQTDVELPGSLPLVLHRQHHTQYDRGHWFGRRWASTLDQHLALTADEAVMTTPDGVVLHYPAPSPGASVMPVGGDRWPLTWDGAPGGRFTVTDPRRGWTWEFAPLAGVPPRFVLGSPVLPLRSLSDRNGHRIDYLYDGDGVPCEVRHSGGYRVAVDSRDGLLTGYRLLNADPDTHQAHESRSIPLISFGYGDTGDLSEVTNSSSRPLRFTYDAQHRITSWTDRNGTWYQYTYDDAGRCVHGVGTDGVMDNTFVYGLAAQTTRMTDALGHTREFAWDRWGRVHTETDPLGHAVRKTWDAYHRLTSVTDPLGNTTRYTYDEPGNLTSITHPDGGRTDVDVDPTLCRPVRVTAADGTEHRYTWDQHGNLLTVTDPTGATTRHTYDAAGNPTATTDALGHTTRITCNAAGLPLAVTDPLGNTTRAHRDAFGRTASVTDPLGHSTHSAHTVEGRPAWRELADGSTESWTWDAEGNLLHHENAAGFTTRFESHAFDLPSAQTTADGARHAFTYDAELRLTQVTNPLGLTWTYTYDPAGRLTSETDFNGRTLTYEHDAAGRLTSRVNGAGEEVAYTHDAFGNILTSVHTATGRATTFTYDPLGRLLSALNPDVALSFTRDACGRILAETSNDRTLTNTYDALGRRTRRETPSGHVSEWTYSATGQPTRLSTAGRSLDFTYDAADRESTRHFGDHVTFTREWDPVGRLTAQSTSLGEQASPLALALDPTLAPRETHRRTYTWRPDGYLTSLTDTTTGRRTYDLDPTGRITAVTGPGWTERYAYDPLGNVTHAQWPSTSDDESQGDRVVTGTLTHRAGRTHYRYDTQGRLTHRTRKTLSGKRLAWTFAWDADDRLTDVTTPTGDQWHYTYDPLARRTSKSRVDADEHVTFTWDGAHLTEDQHHDDTSRAWDFLPGTWLPLTQTSQNTVHAVAPDTVGRPTALLDDTGGTVWSARPTTWGTDGATATCPLGFPGQYWDEETGLYQNLFRSYDPETASFISPDPLGLAASPNPHTYVPNPTHSTDPLGLTPDPNCGETNRPAPNITDKALSHSFDRHAAQWFGGEPSRTVNMTEWQAIIERTSQSSQVVPWSSSGKLTNAYLSRIDGKWFVAQFDRESGDLVTAFVPNSAQVRAMLGLLGK